jgi:hypothetical protein
VAGREANEDAVSEDGFKLVLPFWIDTDAYSDRDRSMFTAGFEFAQVVVHMEENDGPMERPIHPENESRIRMAAGRLGRTCRIEPLAEGWKQLQIEARA